MKIVLASKSPRRISMMQSHGYDPYIFPADIEEAPPLHGGAIDTPLFLSFKKALHVENMLEKEIAAEHPYIIAADTIVFFNQIIGKPKDKNDAQRILMSLSGNAHQVITGVSIIKAGTSIRKSFSCITDVSFKKYAVEDLADYLDTEEPYDKAGAYAIQGYFHRFIDHYHGSYDNVVGFPWEEILAALEALDEK